MEDKNYPFVIAQSWGIASARHTSSCVVSINTPDGSGLASSVEHEFDVPIGPSVVRWNVRTQRRLLQFQAHPDLITCMRLSPDKRHIVTTSYRGEVKLWSGQGWKCDVMTQAPMAQQHHLAWRPDSTGFVIVGNGFSSSIAMYSLLSADCEPPKLELRWQVEAENIHVDDQIGKKQVELESRADATLHGGSKSGRDYHYTDAFTMAEVNPSFNVFAVKESKDGQVSTHLFSVGGKLMKSVNISEKSVVLLSTYNGGVGGYGMVVGGGCVLILDAESLDVKNKFQPGYVSKSCVWDGENLVLPSDSGELAWWSVSGDKLFEASVGSSDYIVHLDWSLSGRAVWMCGFSTLRYVEVEKNLNGTVERVESLSSMNCHDITCCGVAFSDGGEWLCAGDLAGGVWVMQGSNSEPVHKCSVGTSVRCLQWWGESRVLIGSLGGSMYDWKVGEEVKELYTLKGSVIIMRWSQNRKCLAVGLSTGVLAVYCVAGSLCEDLSFVTSFIAHPPQEGNRDMRFGQLSKQAEIWSLCWSPNDSCIATCSEDQTTKIWNTKNWTCEATLRGHTMAVTSVDWREDSGGHAFLATCSDDRTIRVMDGNTFELVHTCSTHDLYGWHTLTYLAFHICSSSVAVLHQPLLLTCTTQNGYVVVWDVRLGVRVACERIHCGSIEGLAWNTTTGALATVGADCVVHLFELNLSCCGHPNL